MESDYSVLIVGAAILLVPDLEKPGDYADVINSVLFAQLVANKQVEKDPSVDWYDAYAQVIDNVWSRFIKTRENIYFSSDSEASVATLSVAAMAKMNEDLGRLTAAVMSRLINVPGSNPAMSLLRRHMQKADDDHMMLIVAQTPDSFSSVYINLQPRQLLDSHPLVPLSPGPNLQGAVTLRSAQAHLSEALYRLAREGVALKVKDRIAANVVRVTEGDEPGWVDLSREIKS